MIKIPAIGLILIFLQSCRTYPTYQTNVANVPLFSRKGEIQGNGFVGSNHIELQGAYAPLKNMATQANLYLSKTGIYGEAGIGAFVISKKDWCAEIFTGYGYCYSNFHDSITTSNLFSTIDKVHEIKTPYHQLFIQPDIGFKSKFFEIALTCRLNYAYYPTYYYNYREYDHHYSNLSSPTGADTLVGENLYYSLLVPGIIVKGGGRRIKGYGMLLVYTPLNFTRYDPLDNNLKHGISPFFYPFIVGIGVTVALRSKFTAKETVKIEK